MAKRSWPRVVLSHARYCRIKMTISVICAVIGVFGGLIPYFAVYRIIQLFIDGIPEIGRILFFSGVGLAGYLVKQLFHMTSTMLSHISAYTILERIRLEISERLMKAPLGVVINERAGKMKNIIMDRVESIEIPLAHVIPELFSHVLLPICVFVYLCTIDWRLALATLVTVPIAAVSLTMMMRNFNQQYADYMKTSNHVNSVMVEYSEGIEVIKAFNQSASSYEKYASAVKSLKDYTLAWFRSTWAVMNFTMAVLPSSLLGSVPVALILYRNGIITPSEAVMGWILSLGIIAPLMKFSIFVNDAKIMEYAVNAVQDLLELPELSDSSVRRNITNYDVVFRNVDFSYGGDDGTKVLHEVDLVFPEGSFNALVGPSGGGKSTIGRLAARFWDVGSGSVSLGGFDIRDIPLSQLMECISYVTQDNFLFDCSLLENIRLGNPSATDEDVYSAAKAAQCDEFISRFEKGYDTSAGEAGNRLSGGEKQRIAIARAILKDAPVVILDEATAFTDPENESKIQRAFSKLVKGKTLLVIAHRLSTIRNADQIVLMEKGRVREIGTHDELMESSSLYEGMWNAHVGSASQAVSSHSEIKESNYV